METWEYKRLEVARSLTIIELNKYGGLGWELVQKIKDTGFTWTYIFKRKIDTTNI